jgi:amidase
MLHRYPGGHPARQAVLATDGARVMASYKPRIQELLMSSTDPFVPGPRLTVPGTLGGPLSGLTFAAKDLFDVAGFPTGGGNPDWPTFPLPSRHAWLVQTLLDAGADLIGKTITDEVSLGILGENAFYGTPVNPHDPGRVPGGSSSGSASAVAAALCDFAIGTDTGGSVRVPASFCGLFGIRPTHGRLNLGGMMGQAPTSDTAGWLARDVQSFTRVAEAVFEQTMPDAPPRALIIAVDAFGIADAAVRTALEPAVRALARVVQASRDETMAPPGLSTWARAQRTLQPYEGWLTFKDWLDEHNPRMAFGVARNLVLASQIPQAERQWANQMRADARARMQYLLEPDTVLCMPSTPFPAPETGLSISAQAPLRDRIACLTSPGGMTGVCQVSVPVGSVNGLPVGLSIVGAPGNDLLVVATAQALSLALQS